jgi:phage-related protein
MSRAFAYRASCWHPASALIGVYQGWYICLMAPSGHEHDRRRPILEVVFFRTEAGNEPVREWLRGLVRQDRKTVGEDIKTAQFGWPLGMPLIRKLATGLWEVRSHVSTGIARVIFTVDGQTMVLLHGFQKKSQRTPPADLMTARRRLAQLQSE